MASDYDRKFEEMKKYIPFLESMIKRLESSTSSAANPRQAQLDKIRSLRDLLLDKKKRMKMDNLLKCEQVLVNLYAKVEKRDTLPFVKDENKESIPKDKKDLEAVRNKLNSITQNADTLPEIARASEIEEICEPGSKEPALFQRRPNRSSQSPVKHSSDTAFEKISPMSNSKRSYTRVLVSPEPRSSRWAGPDDAPMEKLYCRRSPKRSPKKNTPFTKKVRRKSAKEKKSSKDLNITLKVPEESLHSLNTDDILSRIINCSDGDVDIASLRELRSQILGELKQTGTNDDISDLILKSYNKKSKSDKKNKFDIEEGEISDSESEAIENIYGSLVVMDKEKKAGQAKNSEQNNQQRKIQICLVINAEKEGETKPNEIDLSESGAFANSKGVICIDSESSSPSPNKKKDEQNLFSKTVEPSLTEEKQVNENRVTDTSVGNKEIASPPKNKELYEQEKEVVIIESNGSTSNPQVDKIMSPQLPKSPCFESTDSSNTESTTNIANFYKPMAQVDDDKTQPVIDASKNNQSQEADKISGSITGSIPKETVPILKETELNSKEFTPISKEKNKNEDIEIPLLNEPTLPPKAKKDVLSEIDILQALKNEILSETISIAATEANTPALHIPKISKVASTSDTSSSGSQQPKVLKPDVPKKRISIENYKKKSANAANSLYLQKLNNPTQEEMIKKQSLKLTEKECERFKLPSKLSLDGETDDISDDDMLDDDNLVSLDDIYGDLAPKSPDQDNFSDYDEDPILIPVEPVKTTTVNSSDVDMRSLQTVPQPVPPPANVAAQTSKIGPDRKPLVDPRLRRELGQQASKESPNPHSANLEGTPRPSLFPNIPHLMSMRPVYTPSYTPSVTPMRTPNSATFEMTPTHQSFEVDDSRRKHVYAPSFSSNERDNPTNERPVWEVHKPGNSNDDQQPRRDGRSSVRWESHPVQRDSQPSYDPMRDKCQHDRRESYSKPEPTLGPNVGWSDCPGTPGSSFGRLERPMTPSHSFDRSECPATPIHPFGRSDCPATPTHPFGRLDCPPTPSHPFGKSECPATPSHSLVRSECPPTQNHPFGRAECPGTPIHPFGRCDGKDPRLKRRQTEYETRVPYDEDDRVYKNDRNYRSGSYKSHRPHVAESRNYDREHGRNDRYANEYGGRYSKSRGCDSPRPFDRDQSIGRNDKNYSNESPGRSYDRYNKREHSFNRYSSVDESNRLYTRSRERRFDNRYEEIGSQRIERDISVGRTTPREPVRSACRASSVGRSLAKEVEYGCSSITKSRVDTFTIDTSVNATFQKLIESGKGIQVFDYSFDARRQRAASVGRSLTRESSVGRPIQESTKSTEYTYFERRKDFQRAGSVGRVLTKSTKEKSFREIKADLESYKPNIPKVLSNGVTVHNNKNKKDKINLSNRNVEHVNEDIVQNSKRPYSPRKNGRDPRMRKEQKDHKNRNDRSSSNISRDRRHSGIVYSNDNIAKGTTMGSGFGVKNYKIPKIKRPEPEPLPEPMPEPKSTTNSIKTSTKLKLSADKADSGKTINLEKSKDKKRKDNNSDDNEAEKVKLSSKTHTDKKISTQKSIEKEDDNSNDSSKSKTKLLKQKESKKTVISDDDSDVRVTRSSRRCGTHTEEKATTKKTKLIRKRKPFIDDSDSESEKETRNKKNTSKMNTAKLKGDESPLSTKLLTNKGPLAIEKDSKKSNEEDSLDSNFVIDDLGLFNDNIVSDPVIGNISALIADLDNDLVASKSEHDDSFTTDMENIMGGMDSQEENTLGDISDLIEKDLSASGEQLKQILPPDDAEVSGRLNLNEIVSASFLEETPPSVIDAKTLENSLDTPKPSNDEIVSTTQIYQSNNKSVFDKNDLDHTTVTIPDSTITRQCNVAYKEESVPDSTMDIHSEVSSDVTSTHDPEKSLKNNDSPSRKEASTMESIGSLISILKDKSKIKEILSMLGDQSGDTVKLKKKLEKLSEIVSDDEDETTGDDQLKKTIETSLISHSTELSKDVETENVESHSTETPTTSIEIDNKNDEKYSTSTPDVPDKENKSLTNLADLPKDVEIKKAEGFSTETLNASDTLDLSNDKNKMNKMKSIDECHKTVEKVTQEESEEIDKSPGINEIKCSQNDLLEKEKKEDGGKLESVLENNDQISGMESNDHQDDTTTDQKDTPSPKKNITKKQKPRKKGKFKKVNKTKQLNKTVETKIQKTKYQIRKKKAMSRELKTLQNDIKEMFMSDDVLNATGLRMCRLAKMVDKQGNSTTSDNPVIIPLKPKESENSDEPEKKIRKKPGPKPKVKVAIAADTKKHKKLSSQKPGPKSRTKQKHGDIDPYEFDTDSVADTNTTKESADNSSDSDSDSSVSSASFGSTELLADLKKKPKKKRGGWSTGIIKKQKKKKEPENRVKTPEVPSLPQRLVPIPDENCYTDKMYCFRRNEINYDCRLCHYSGTEIVNHYKQKHAHTEIPLSRMEPSIAKIAIQQCEKINFHAVSKIPSEQYICRFCYREFSKDKVPLESFFWHVVSKHTGEFKHLCVECINITRCPFNLDIPPPPKADKGQLIGFICGKCNFTQISLENLKTHVIKRHDDEQTEVYTINLGVMTNKDLKKLLRKSQQSKEHETRTLRSSRSNVSAIDASDERSEVMGSECDRLSEVGSAVPKIEPDPKIDVVLRKPPGPLRSKLAFEADYQERSDETSVKVEQEEERSEEMPLEHETTQLDKTELDASEPDASEPEQTNTEMLPMEQPGPTSNATLYTSPPITNKGFAPKGTIDVCKEPHFKLNIKESGAKEYMCCINGINHYKTTLLISLKKHVQIKHSENWDGYCCVCKVIVTLQGVVSSFKDCLSHYLDKHMDDFPILEMVDENVNDDSISLRSSVDTIERTESPRSYIAVRPLSDLLSNQEQPSAEEVDPPVCDDNAHFPIIEQVVSLGYTVEPPKTSPVYPTVKPVATPKEFLYEEVQAKVMSKKHRIVLDTMMPKDVLVRVFKCAGRFCSFTSDSAEDAFVHASAHKQLGGEGALDCAYCNFDALGNAIDLVMHVFKDHGRCLYACALCFYRASAEQLVGAHYTKAHASTGEPLKVLRTTRVLPDAAPDSSGIMSREVAVPYYICNHAKTCKFRTYTPGKYCEHLQQKHGSESSHPCNMCSTEAATPSELITHMKDHGLKLYQCTWCVHGANSEAEMLEHAAATHPAKKPQAYLRIITNKEGSTEKRVLPLIFLVHQKVPVEDVSPSNAKENPTKEAERSIELEKLISHTALLAETTTEMAQDPVPDTPETVEAPPEVAEEPAAPTDLVTAEAIENSLLLTPKKTTPDKPDESVVPVVKLEPKQKNNQATEVLVYCLDSDEEDIVAQKSVTQDTTEEVINLSDDEPEPSGPVAEYQLLKHLIATPLASVPPSVPENPTFIKLPLQNLFRCPKCEHTAKNAAAFKRHSNGCCAHMTTLSCPHSPCPIILSNTTQLINHYNKDHLSSSLTKHYICGICKSNWGNLNATKKHLKEKHNVFKVVIISKMGLDGICTFTLNKESATREQPKRKVSVEIVKKYGINDVDKLPINPILDSLVYCEICEFSTKVRLNMVRHLLLHAERQPVPQTAPVNPVPHLESNEKHFDKMVNLASSSAATRVEKPSSGPAVSPDVVSRYPKYVTDRQRLACGAKGCSYISLDEEMLRRHWETLHSEATDYHCVHCPTYQHLNTARSLTAQRIIAHLKMHDTHLYACSSCSYYHYKRQIVDKHIAETHKHGQVLIVREEGSSNIQTAAPTMDLKPWQCGMCQFKSMLRPEVVEHCSKTHQTKMQFKCAYCPFRTSAIENITKHQTNSHPTKTADVFYYYYREGTIPNEPDGTARWQKQRQKSSSQDPAVKMEKGTDPLTPSQPLPAPAPVDLNIVKKEVVDDSGSEVLTADELCKKFGQFCEPNGIKYMCPLCKTVSEHTQDVMKSHLYEELKYRRWGCALCPYKAFHRNGLNEHTTSEHNRNFLEPTKLPANVNIEKWVTSLLDHQLAIINQNKENFAKQKIIVEKQTPGPSKVVEPPKQVQLSSDTELEQAFGSLGTPKDEGYCCPKCSTVVKDEDAMRDHLESELTKIRWCCTKCTDKFQTYHVAQFHCKSVHAGQHARPKEAIRDPSLRTAWISAVINAQKQTMNPGAVARNVPDLNVTDTSENSLLVVRYEEPVTNTTPLPRKRPASPGSDDDSPLEIYEPEIKHNVLQCPICPFYTKYKHVLRDHHLRHYKLKVYTCGYCGYNGTKKEMKAHLDNAHANLPHIMSLTQIPDCPPAEYKIRQSMTAWRKLQTRFEVCLHCEKNIPEDEIKGHAHDNITPIEFGNRGEDVVKCCICLALRKDLESMRAHYATAHGDITRMNYVFYKLQVDTRELQACGICKRRFTFMRDLKMHHSNMHSSYTFCHTTVPYAYDEDLDSRGKRKLEATDAPPAKRVARKSTTKLPSSAYAKKSTTKLPFAVDLESDGGYSYYGTKPASFDQYANVTTNLTMYNTTVEIELKKLSGLLNIDPKVVVIDCKKNSDSASNV